MTKLLRWLSLCIVLTALAPLPGQASSTPLLSAQTRVFQQGLAGYTGVRDTWVSRHDWDSPPQHTVNYGLNEGLELSRDDGDNPLLRFDLGSIPANSAVLTATLALYNTTESSFSGAQAFVRRVRAFQVLRDWDEGNRVASPINVSGAHGATGDYAFRYFPGQGVDVPWSARGMAAGSDYAVAAESTTGVVNPGWYTWDVTDLVQRWVRGDQPNFGLTLRDATGYQDDHRDWRTFVSSQAANTALRPKLTVVYNPDVPFASAGPDQENLTWSGGAITLDGSASHDRPGGNNATLLYTWRVLTPAYGSALAPQTLIASGVGAAGQTATFTPDRAGEWDIELTVTNALGERATDTMHLRLLRIPASHPRIYLDPAKLAALQAQAVSGNPRWDALLAEAADPTGEMHAQALAGVLTGQSVYCQRAIGQALALIAAPGRYGTKGGDVALVYDWCYSQLSASQRATFVTFFNAWGDQQVNDPYDSDVPGWGNYWTRYAYSFALVGLASYGENPRAQEWLDHYRHWRFRDNDLHLLERIAEGGGWPEGMIYDWIANWPRVKALEAWRTATGEDLFQSTDWFRQRLGYLLLHRWPGLAEQWGHWYHPYLSTGDTERNRASIANYERIMGLILIERFTAEPLAQQLQAYLSAPPTNGSQSFLAHEEFLWYNPSQPSQPPSQLSHLAAGLGTVFLRSGWPDGAADTDPSATYLTFQSGDHFTYHQHYDQNSFTLFKHGDLLLDSGVYSGDGLSNHDVNFYVRTIAHNTLVVYNPSEDFSSARPDAESNDGGQRTFYPASRSPQTVEYWDQHAVHYDTGDLLRYEDTAQYAYALGDATKAYNNPSYNQAMDTWLSGNVAKVSRFQREFVYLRPRGASPADYLLLLDRVGVTQPAFSGANTKLLFHTLSQPVVNGAATVVSPGETLYTGADLATAVNGAGKVFIKTLLPAQRNLRVVGGRGVKSFWVFGDNHDWHWDPSEPQPRPVNDFEDVPYGEWRLELEPAGAGLQHTFLTVLYPTSSAVQAMPVTVLVQGSGMTGAHIADPALNRLALFSAAADGSPPGGAISYSFSPTARTLHLLLDLPPGAAYTATITQAGGSQSVTLTPASGGALRASDQGVLSFLLDPSGSLLPDYNGNGCVDVGDIQIIAQRWGTASSDPYFDRDGDGWITVVDVMRVAALWDSACTAPLVHQR